jgi:formylmethanofuran dehydrogenase subunit B
LPSASLADVPQTDLLVYWGSNPHHSHPRHLSRYTLYKHPEYQELGARRTVTAVAIEVRESETTISCHRVFRLLPRGDRELIQGVLKAMDGEEAPDNAVKLLDLMRRSRFCMMFVGLGLTYSLDNDFTLFIEMVNRLNKLLTMAVVPMVGHFNMRGFNETLREATGFVNKVSFANGVSCGEEFSLLDQVKGRRADCVMVIGADPFSSLPRSVAEGLKDVTLITLDPFHTTTTRGSRVVIGTGVSGVEVGGTAVRMDGERVRLAPPRGSDCPSDEEVLKRLLEKVER